MQRSAWSGTVHTARVCRTYFNPEHNGHKSKYSVNNCYFLQVIHMLAVDFQLDDNYFRCGDYLSIYDGSDENAVLIGQYCYNILVPVFSSQPSLYLKFYSDANTNMIGFVVKWKAIPSSKSVL